MAWKDKEKRRQYVRNWRARRVIEEPEAAAEAAEKHADKQREYYRNNRERILEDQKIYRDANREKIYGQQKEYRDSNRPLISARNRFKKYGITIEEFDALVASQGGKCAICGDVLDVDGCRKIHVDHCHSTDKVRSILCSGCNVGLGHFRESPGILRLAAKYAEKFAVAA